MSRRTCQDGHVKTGMSRRTGQEASLTLTVLITSLTLSDVHLDKTDKAESMHLDSRLNLNGMYVQHCMLFAHWFGANGVDVLLNMSYKFVLGLYDSIDSLYGGYISK